MHRPRAKSLAQQALDLLSAPQALRPQPTEATMPAPSSALPTSAHPVDERLPAPKLAALGLQHVLVM